MDDILSSLEDAPLPNGLVRELNKRDRDMNRNGGVTWASVKKKMTV